MRQGQLDKRDDITIIAFVPVFKQQLNEYEIFLLLKRILFHFTSFIY